MPTIAYTVAAALIGTGAAVTSQVAISPQESVEPRVEASKAHKVPIYDFDKFAAEVIVPASGTDGSVANVEVQRLVPVRVASLRKRELTSIVRDQALAEKADRLAAETVVDEEASESLINAALVPLPKSRPSDHALTASVERNRNVKRRKVSKRRKVRRAVRVAEASTSRQSRLARRLRSKGWFIGAFR